MAAFFGHEGASYTSSVAEVICDIFSHVLQQLSVTYFAFGLVNTETLGPYLPLRHHKLPSTVNRLFPSIVTSVLL